MKHAISSTGLAGSSYAAGSLGRAWVKLIGSLARLGRGGSHGRALACTPWASFVMAQLSAVTQARNEAADLWPLTAPEASPNFVRLDLQLAVLRESALIKDQLWGRYRENKALSAEFQALAQELEVVRLNFHQRLLRERSFF